jgi:hypothetical protein
VRIVAADEARRQIAERGGTVYLWPRPVRCCGGRGYVLDASFHRPDRAFELVHSEPGLAIHALQGLVRPRELHLELSGSGRLQAFWDGQSWIG